jgi:heme exporter protein CcmD
MINRPDLWASYIWPSYILTIAGLVVLLVWSFTAMRRAERKAESLRKRP